MKREKQFSVLIIYWTFQDIKESMDWFKYFPRYADGGAFGDGKFIFRWNNREILVSFMKTLTPLKFEYIPKFIMLAANQIIGRIDKMFCFAFN